MKKRLIAVFMTCAFMFTTLPIATGSYSYAAAPKRPAQVKALKVIAKTQSSVTIRWSKVKNAKGYVIYRYDYKAKKWKAIKKVSAKTLKYKNTKLKAGTKYAYKVRAYNSYKQKQYYNSKTRKWITKKPKKSQWKGKKTRTVTKYVYGPASATVAATTKKKAATAATNTSNNAKSSANATTNNSARTSTSTNSNTVKDTAFKNSTMANKVLYIDKSNSYNDCLYKLATSKSEKDAIKWTSSNTKVATVEKDLYNGSEALVVVKGKGTATITATNWDGQKKTATVTVKSANDNASVITEPEKSDNGVVVSNGKVYPASDGIFEIHAGQFYDFNIDGAEVNFAEVTNYFPSGSTFRVNAAEMIKETTYTFNGSDLEGVHSQVGYVSGTTLTSISNKAVMIDTTVRGHDTSANGVFFLSPGTATATCSDGKKFTFIVSGENPKMQEYRQYVIDFVNANQGKTKMEIAEKAIKKCLDISYGPCNDPFATITSTNKVGGNCFAKAYLLQRLLTESGIECHLHTSIYNDTGGRHMVCEVIIGGTTYIADPTNEIRLLSEAEYESWHNANVYDNRIDSIVRPSIIN